MKIVVINLERSVDRRRRMERQFSSFSLSIDVFPALDGRRGDHLCRPQYDPGASARYFGEVMMPGEVACFASHYTVWEACATGDDWYLVCEDDLLLSDRFPAAIGHLPAPVARHGLVRLYGTNPERPFRKVSELEPGLWLVRFLRGPSGTQCYGLSPDGARRLLANCRGWLEPVDRYVDRFWLHGLGNMALYPFPLVALEQSDIGPRERRGTVFKTPRKLLRFGDHIARIAYNLHRR